MSINDNLAHRINYMRVQIHMLQEQLAKMKKHAKRACEDMSTIVNNFQLLGMKAISNPDLKETTFDKMNSLKTVLDHYDDKRQEYQIMVIQYHELVQINRGSIDPSVTDIRKIDDTNNYVGLTINDMLGKLAAIVAQGVEPEEKKMEEDEDFLALMDEIVDEGEEDKIDPEPNPDESSIFQFQVIKENKECLKLLDEFDPALCIE